METTLTTRDRTYRELEILRRDYPVKTAKEIAASLKRSVRSVFVMAQRLGLKKGHFRTTWTPAMVALIRTLYPNTFNNALSKCLGVSKRTLIRKARELGLEKEEGFIEKKEGDIAQLISIANKRSSKTSSRYKKGVHATPSCEFKKGHVESPETKAKRAAAIKESWRRRKQQAQFRKDYNINNKTTRI